MLTQCPNCQTTFRVTNEILRVASGQVRCGRCQTQFDALDRLLDEQQTAEIESGRFLRPDTASSAQTRAEEIDDERVAAENATSEDEREFVEGSNEAEEHEDLFSDDRPDQPDAALDTGGIEVVESDQPASDEAAASIYRQHIAAAADDSSAAPTPDVEFDLLSAPRRRPRSRWWAVATPLLLVLLAGQVLHHHRAELARHPIVGQPLANIYAALGLTLTPDWNLHAYEIRQWGVISDPSQPGALKVRATITNLAPFAQPYPLLKLVLEDRWGDQVRARAFTPAEYLDPTTAPDRLLAPAQKANATIIIVDPGPDAEGFRFDVCLPGRYGEVCAEEAPRA